MHHALYRKYRPKTFADVFGQKSITEALKNQIASGKVGHAYIFTGTRGTGKTTCAKIFARAVNCLNPQDGEPCGVCANCRGLEEGSILDVVEIDAASNNGVDDIRDLRDEAVYTPTNCKYKVYIVDEVHMLSTSAFNALLKIMEEPPSHVIFILATTEIHKVPATILSRCQRYDFGRIRPEIIEERLTIVANEENIPVTPEAKRLIAHLADGALRDALSILDTCASATEEAVDEPLVRRMAGVTDKSYLFSLSDAVKEQDAAKAILLVAELREKAIDMK
ncbi:MAG: DNA polymerase III subunit gamma/tau, partial [Pygmaiobacter massiliensis]